jgi:hypothetical protein
VSSNVAAPAAPNGDNGNHQGHCSRCGKVWTLKERQGICQWCGKLAVCQSSQTKPRHIKSRSNGRRKQPNGNGNGYDHLQGEWLTYYKVALPFARVKVKYDQIGKPLTEVGLIRVAYYERAQAIDKILTG